jgi:hypothetical protein
MTLPTQPPTGEKPKNCWKQVLQGDLVDVLSLNENEAIFYASLLKGKAQKT